MNWRTTLRILLLTCILDQGAGLAHAQATGRSPYSAYGLGDLVRSVQVSQVLTGGTGLAITEPFSVIVGNPASYASMARPTFEVGFAARSVVSKTEAAKSTRYDGRFTGFTVGVPFGKGKWGMALGLIPHTTVGYQMNYTGGLADLPVEYTYTGSGGIQRAFGGLGRVLYSQPADSLGNIGQRVSVGANFNFLFGGIEQTREARYPAGQGFANTKAFSALVLRAPMADASLLWQGDLTRKTHRDDDNWRWSAGASIGLPTRYNAKYALEVSSFATAGGMDVLRDSISVVNYRGGKVRVPLQWGLGLGIQNRRWAVSAEVHRRDWSATEFELPGYVQAAPMQAAVTYALGGRFRPGNEGMFLKRSVYRLGMRYDRMPQQVRGTGLEGTTASVGVSLPLNAVQTNSWLHVGGEFTRRGTTEQGLLREMGATLWLGVAFTPWRGERWFIPYRIQ